MSERPDQLLFTYGSLQRAEIQLETFGRLLKSEDDILSGFTVDYAEFADARVPDASGPTMNPVLRATGNPRDKVTGLVFWVSEDELEAADEYQVALYRRDAVTLSSGRIAWVYVTP